LLLARLAFGDIEDESESDAATVVAHLHFHDIAHPYDLPVGSQYAIFEVFVARIFVERCRMLAGCLAILRQDHGPPLFLIFQDLRIRAQYASDLWADIEEAPRVDVPGVRHDIRCLHQMAKAPLALLEREFGATTVGDIQSDAYDVADRAI